MTKQRINGVVKYIRKNGTYKGVPDDTDTMAPDQGQNVKQAPLSDPDNLLSWFDTASDADVDQLVNDLRSSGIDSDGKQQDDDITRFFNSIGWTDRKPDVMPQAQYQQVLAAAGNPDQIYHTDANFGGTDAREFAKQFMGNLQDASGNAYRQYMSNGYYGNGTYFADSANGSSGYGTSQFRGFFNANAKIAKYSSLSFELSQLRYKNKAFDKFFGKLTGGYSGTNAHDDSAAISVFAAMKGYNVIHDGYTYYTVLDRSVVTMSSKTKKATYNMGDW